MDTYRIRIWIHSNTVLYTDVYSLFDSIWVTPGKPKGLQVTSFWR